MAGLLKRKRSDSELSFASSTTLSSPSRPSASFIFSASAAEGDAPVSPMFGLRTSMPQHLPSRTLKRYRNNRPPDAAVHEHTLSLLFAAQQSARHQPSSPDPAPMEDAPEPSSPPPPPCDRDHASPKQPSLHRFWGFPAPASRLASRSASPAACSTVAASGQAAFGGRREGAAGSDGELCMADS